MLQFISYIYLQFTSTGILPNWFLVTKHHVHPTHPPIVDQTYQCINIPIIQLLPATCPAAPTLPLPTLSAASATPAPPTILNTPTLRNSLSRVTFDEAYTLQAQLANCALSAASPALADAATLWTKIAEVGVQWCCTAAPGCAVVAQYRSIQVVLCAPRELCVRCFSVSFALGRIMVRCEKGGRVQGELGSSGVLLVGVRPHGEAF